MGKLSKALRSVVSEVSVVVGPKTMTKAIVCANHSLTGFKKQATAVVSTAKAEVGDLVAKRIERKALFNRLNS